MNLPAVLIFIYPSLKSNMKQSMIPIILKFLPINLTDHLLNLFLFPI